MSTGSIFPVPTGEWVNLPLYPGCRYVAIPPKSSEEVRKQIIYYWEKRVIQYISGCYCDISYVEARVIGLLPVWISHYGYSGLLNKILT